MRNGQHGASFGGAAERFQHARFGFGIEVRGDFVQQQHRRVRRRRAGNGQQLPFPLRKHAVCADGIVPVRKCADGVIHSRQFRGILCHFLGDGGVGKRNLVKHRPRYAGEALFHAADARAALMVGNRRNVHAADGNIPLFRLI